MILFFRIILVGLLAKLRSRVAPLEPSRLRLTVLPTDCDLYRHLNNGRYLSLMDLGRLDMAIRNGSWKLMIANKWYPVAASAAIRYRKSIELFERFDLQTRIVGWDEKWYWIEQQFLVGDELRADAVLKVVFLHGRETIPPAKVNAALGLDLPPNYVPEWIAHWIETEDVMKTREE